MALQKKNVVYMIGCLAVVYMIGCLAVVYMIGCLAVVYMIGCLDGKGIEHHQDNCKSHLLLTITFSVFHNVF